MEAEPCEEFLFFTPAFWHIVVEKVVGVFESCEDLHRNGTAFFTLEFVKVPFPTNVGFDCTNLCIMTMNTSVKQIRSFAADFASQSKRADIDQVSIVRNIVTKHGKPIVPTPT